MEKLTLTIEQGESFPVLLADDRTPIGMIRIDTEQFHGLRLGSNLAEFVLVPEFEAESEKVLAFRAYPARNMVYTVNPDAFPKREPEDGVDLEDPIETFFEWFFGTGPMGTSRVVVHHPMALAEAALAKYRQIRDEESGSKLLTGVSAAAEGDTVDREPTKRLYGFPVTISTAIPEGWIGFVQHESLTVVGIGGCRGIPGLLSIGRWIDTLDESVRRTGVRSRSR